MCRMNGEDGRREMSEGKERKEGEGGFMYVRSCSEVNAAVAASPAVVAMAGPVDAPTMVPTRLRTHVCQDVLVQLREGRR